MKCPKVPPATAARLPLYVRGLKELARSRVTLASSRILAEATGLEAHKIRKDLSCLGTFGKRGVGYQVDDLLHQLSSFLSLSRTWRVALVGYGRLGSALASYLAISDCNFQLAAIFDCSSHKIGVHAGAHEILSWRTIPSVASSRAIDMAVIATPPVAAQGVVDLLVDGGVHLIVNFSPVTLHVPHGVTVRNVDLSSELEALCLQQSLANPIQVRNHIVSGAPRGATTD